MLRVEASKERRSSVLASTYLRRGQSVPDERANPQATFCRRPPATERLRSVSSCAVRIRGQNQPSGKQGWYAHACVCQVPATVTTGTSNIAVSFRTTINQYPGHSSIYPRIQRNPRQRHAATIASQRRGKGVRKQSLRFRQGRTWIRMLP
jgi:hypothetical protein